MNVAIIGIAMLLVAMTQPGICGEANVKKAPVKKTLWDSYW